MRFRGVSISTISTSTPRAGLARFHSGRSCLTTTAKLVIADRPSYFCRGCGKPAAPRFRGHFHMECLQADKRRRVRARHLREQQRFQRWLQKFACPPCGAKYAEAAFDVFKEYPCAAHKAVGRHQPKGRRLKCWEWPSTDSELQGMRKNERVSGG